MDVINASSRDGEGEITSEDGEGEREVGGSIVVMVEASKVEIDEEREISSALVEGVEDMN